MFLQPHARDLERILVAEHVVAARVSQITAIFGIA